MNLTTLLTLQYAPVYEECVLFKPSWITIFRCACYTGTPLDCLDRFYRISPTGKGEETMAIVRKLERITLDRESKHSEVDECTYSIIQGEDGGKSLQIDTYGSAH